MDFTYPGLFNQYSSQVLLNDMTGMNLYPPMGFTMGYDYGMGMDSSIFNCSPYNMGGYMMPFTGNYEQYDKYQKQLIQSQVRQQQNMREADNALNSAQRSIRQNLINLGENINKNEQDLIMPAFRELTRSIDLYNGGNSDPKALKDQALETYERQMGKTLQAHIREHGDGSFVSGLKQIGFLTLGNNISAEENISEITGNPVSKKEKYQKMAGNGLAGATWGGALSFLPVVNKVVRKTWIGALAGLVGGIILGSAASKNV